MSIPVALKQTTIETVRERPKTASRSVVGWRKLLMPLASLKLTIVLFALSIFLVFASTLAQKELDVWDVIRGWYRVEGSDLINDDFPYFHAEQLFVRIPLQIFFPDTFFPHPPQTSLALWFPRGWLIGLLMAINLIAAHSVRFTVQSKGTRLWSGVGVIALGGLATWLAIESGASRDGVLEAAIIEWSTLWRLFLTGLTALSVGGIVLIALLPDDRIIERVAIGVLSLLGGIVVTYFLFFGESINPEAMRILWQLLKGTGAGLVLLVGCQMVFNKRAGIVLLHAGVGLMFLYEVIVGTSHDEAQMPLFEGTKSNWVHDVRAVELAITAPGEKDEDRVTVVAQKALRDGETIALPDLPFDARIVKYFRNSKLRSRGPHEPTPATAGAGLEVAVDELPPVSGVDVGKKSDLTSAYVEFLSKDDRKPLGTYLMGVELWHMAFVSGMPEPQTIDVGGKSYVAEMRYKQTYKPYSIEAAEVRRDDYVAGDKPRNYSSLLHVVDETRNVDRQELIKMNSPMRFAGETFYQSGYDNINGLDFTTISVVENEGWMLPYVSCMIVALGMLVQFGSTLSRFLSRRRSLIAVAAEPAPVMAPTQGKGAAKRAAKQQLIVEPVEADPSVFPWLIPALGFVFIAAMVAYTARPPKAKPEEMNFFEFGKLPVAYQDRVKPFDSLARSTLSMLSHRQTFKENLDDSKEKSKPPTKWLLDLITRAPDVDDYPVFRIDNLDALEALGLERNKHSRYSLNQLRAQNDTFMKEVKRLEAKKVGIEPFEREIIKLNSKVQTYLLIEGGFLNPDFELPPTDAEAERDPVDAARKSRVLNAQLAGVAGASREMKAKKFQPPLGVPDGSNGWKTYTDENMLRFLSLWARQKDREGIPLADDIPRQANPAAEKLHTIFAAYEKGDAPAFNVAVADYRDYLAANPPQDYDPVRRDSETYLNYADPFFWASWMYMAAFVVACLSWLGWTTVLNRTALWMIVGAFVYHTASLALRMYVTDRFAPVTNLYSSAVFIGWGAVLLGMILEAVYKVGVGNVMASVAGFGSLQIAYLLTRQGDTIEELQAVLDTTFWLSTHVTCITLGYATTYAAGLLGMIYLVLGVGTRDLTADVSKVLTRMIYGTLCFALFFSFVGTVLGGLWADDSWGRFWGWDPKENGALIIVLWNALVLHARWDGMIKDRGLAVLAIAGNITTSWSWFGVNQLGVGLHAYGFSAELLSLLFWFCAGSFAAVLVGLLPRQYWMSGDGKAA